MQVLKRSNNRRMSVSAVRRTRKLGLPIGRRTATIFLLIFLVCMIIAMLRYSSVSKQEDKQDHPVISTEHYISLFGYDKNMRLGNLMSRMATPFGLALQFGWQVVFKNVSEDEDVKELAELFDFDALRNEALRLGVIHFDSHLMRTVDLSGWTTLSESKTCAFDQNIYNHVVSATPGRNLKIGVYLQSYRYFLGHNGDIHKLFLFRHHIRDAAQNYLHLVRKEALEATQRLVNAKLAHPAEDVVFIGVHIRRGDFLNLSAYGFSTADISYIYNAMSYFIKRFKDSHLHIAFVICSDAPTWLQSLFSFAALTQRYETLYGNSSVSINSVSLEQRMSVTVHYPSNSKLSVNGMNSLAHLDFSILAHCNHTIMTVGTFGFWAAFLANGTTVYFNQPFVPGTHHARNFDMADTYFPHWIPLSGMIEQRH